MSDSLSTKKMNFQLYESGPSTETLENAMNELTSAFDLTTKDESDVLTVQYLGMCDDKRPLFNVFNPQGTIIVYTKNRGKEDKGRDVVCTGYDHNNHLLFSSPRAKYFVQTV